jgi:spectinomycin phosphotransferase
VTRPCIHVRWTITDEKIERVIRDNWLEDARDVSYLPVGFGAFHWRVCSDTGRSLFVTLDQLAPRHTAESLENAYAGAAALARADLGFIAPPLRAWSGPYTVNVGDGALSVTAWVDGRTPTADEASDPRHVDEVVELLHELHCAEAPSGLRRWRPCADAEFPRRIEELAAAPWAAGPLGEVARVAVKEGLAAISRGTNRYLELAKIAREHEDSWVATHGEPHHANQINTASGLKLVDWESLMIAPRERDLVDLVESAGADRLDVDTRLIELFVLEWCLAEIDEYTRWFSSPHVGNVDDHTALHGLHEELATLCEI